jgi:hypothetical protein
MQYKKRKKQKKRKRAATQIELSQKARTLREASFIHPRSIQSINSIVIISYLYASHDFQLKSFIHWAFHSHVIAQQASR